MKIKSSYKRSLITFILLIISSGSIQAQEAFEPEIKNELEIGALSIEKILPLDQLIALASQNSGLVSAIETSQDKTNEELEITKKKWLQNFAFTAGVGYGTGITSNQLTDNVINDARLTYYTQQNMFYNVGFNVRLPFTEFASRKNEIRIKELERDRLEHLKVNEIDQVTDRVIKLYSDLKITLKTVELKTEVAQTNKIALEIVEGFFKAGQTPIDEFRDAVEQNYDAQLELEQAKNQGWLYYKSLKELVGQRILR